MPAWKYRCIPVSTITELEEKANEMGATGWEVYGVTRKGLGHAYIILVKRKG